VVLLLGETREELSGSEWAHVVHGHLGGMPPRVDLAAERALGSLLAEAGSAGLLGAAHDVSDGGLVQTLVEAALRRDVGVRVELEGDPFVALFSESAARVVVAVDPADEERVVALAGEHSVPVTRVGVTTEDGTEAALEVAGRFSIPLAEVREAWSSVLPAALAG
jgi:phosphoribosylformylglycinamidine synthase